jgi:hypothetical protein
MRKLLLFLLLCVCTGVYAQRIDKPGEPYYYYIETIRSGDEISVFISDNEKYTIRYTIIDENEDVVHFKNDADVLNYMSKRGWEFVYVTSTANQFYCFRKLVLNDNDIYKDFKLVKSPYKKKTKKD